MPTDWDKLQEELLAIVLAGDGDAAALWAERTLAAGVTPMDVFERVVTPVLTEVGDRFQRLDIFLPELLQAAEATQTLLARVLTPALRAGQESRSAYGKVVIGTVLGDTHDIGKNIVILMLELHGFDVIDLGADVPAVDFIERARKDQADIIALSAILTASLPHMANVIDLLKGFGARDRFKVVIGGAAATQEFADQIGADGYGRDATMAVEICRRLCAAPHMVGV